MILTLIFLLLFIFTNPGYSSAGDQNIAEFVASTETPGYYFISPALAWALRLCAIALPMINWWTLFSMTVMFGGQLIILYYIQRRFNNYIGKIIAAALAMFLWRSMFSLEINFTQTASIAAVAGMVIWLCWDLYTTHRSRIVHALIGIFFLLLAGAIRWDSLLLCLPFGVMGILYRLFVYYINKNIPDKKEFHNYIRLQILIPMFAMILCVFGSYSIHFAYGLTHPTWAEYVRANDLECDTYDYADKYPTWEENEQQYESAGLKKSWYHMLFQSYTGDINHFSADDMSVMLQFRGSTTKTFSGYWRSLYSFKLVWFLSLVILLIAAAYFGIRRSIIPAAANIFAFFACSYAFVHMGRYPWRVICSFTLAGIILFLIMSSENWPAMNPHKKLPHAVLTSLAFILVVISSLSTAKFTMDKKTFQLPVAAVTNTEKSGLLDYMNTNKNIIYFMENDFYSVHNIWTAKPVNYLDNLFTIFSVFNRGRSADFAKYGVPDLSNFFTYMLTRPNVYTVYDDTWSAYLCDYYNPYVSAGIVDTYAPTGTSFIRFVAPVQSTGDSISQNITDVHLSIAQSEASDNYQVLTFSATINGTALDEYYLNVTNSQTGAIYSYPLVVNGKKLTGKALWMNHTWNFSNTKRTIVGKFDSKYVNLLDITNEPVPFE